MKAPYVTRPLTNVCVHSVAIVCSMGLGTLIVMKATDLIGILKVIQETNVEAPENLTPIQDDDGSDDDGAIMFTPHTIGGKFQTML